MLRMRKIEEMAARKRKKDNVRYTRMYKEGKLSFT